MVIAQSIEGREHQHKSVDYGVFIIRNSWYCGVVYRVCPLGQSTAFTYTGAFYVAGNSFYHGKYQVIPENNGAACSNGGVICNILAICSVIQR